jgi:hypothetical protein
MRLSPRDQLPSPRLDLVPDFTPYLINDPAVTSKTTNHITSVGCPYSCIFCSEPALSGRSWHAWSAKRSIEEIGRLLDASGATGVKLHDALFFVDMKRALAFASGVKTFKIRWGASLHPTALQRITSADLATLRNSGLSRLMIGLESGNQFVVNLVGKRFDVSKIPEMAAKLRDAEIVGMFSFVVGFPTAPADEYPDTILAAHTIHQIWERHQVKIHYASPWPGTEMWALATATPGFAPPTTLSEWAEYDYYVAQMVFHDRRWEHEIDEINRRYCPKGDWLSGGMENYTPDALVGRVLSATEYEIMLRQIRDGLGVRKVSFTGGEPTLNAALPDLLKAAERSSPRRYPKPCRHSPERYPRLIAEAHLLYERRLPDFAVTVPWS